MNNEWTDSSFPEMDGRVGGWWMGWVDGWVSELMDGWMVDSRLVGR